ncbi:adenylate cyclase type 10-like isoform X2 [Sitophilus oryzae]|uniref:Adenylate cyclase type 10-like isoform X2 n=1 Tax=Sitophilus oryzae TaxID=7048 RepID=A0A6J2YLH7_SITOR|nr:adenylate cyclase type 10-like isoform X2 [Sitophilus oryzae]
MEIMATKGSDESKDYYLAMNSTIFKEPGSEDWKKRRAIPLQTSSQQKQSENIVSSEWSRDEHTRIFASLVPDEVIYHINDYSRRHFDGCLLFGDVSGFTDLCEKYNKTGKGGPSKLTQVLNSYIGAMVQEILSHDGDVFKFSGDAFLALWKVTENLSMKDAVHEAIDCSLIIQKTYGRYQADQDVVIRVKLAISAGPLVFSLLGRTDNSHYAISGSTLLDLKAAETQSFAGDIIITKSAWQHVSANEYLAEELKDGLHAKIYGVGPNWRNIQRTATYGKEENYNVVTAHDNLISDMSVAEEDLDETSDMGIVEHKRSSKTSQESQVINTSDQYALRPSVNMCIRMKMLGALKKFILAPVEKGISADEPIEYLTEIRKVTILFINCKFNNSAELKPVKLLDIVDQVYITVSGIVKDNYGCLNKVNIFDKDLLVLVIFGLRGLKHEMECQIALKCAKECYDSLIKIENIMGVGAAVTTGKTYCGAFGHSLRREYTVISLIVNKAARLMVAYPNRVTCDRETFLHSKLESKNFILQKYKPLKGIVNPGPIYEFKEVESTRDVALSVSIRPLLGREQELDLYLHLYKVAKESATMKINEGEFFGMLIIQGESRQGKTRLLEELIFSTDPATPISRVTLTKTDSQKSYTSIRLIFNFVLGLTEKTSSTEKENKILRRLGKVNMQGNSYYLNNIFNVHFSEPLGFHFMDRKVKYKELKRIFKGFCYATFSVFWVIAIDNTEYVDDESWVLLSILSKLNLVFTVGTMGLRSLISPVATEIIKMRSFKVIQMKCIDKWFHVGLVCQMLDVDAIPADLEKVIQERSNGNPGWIESFLITLLQSNGLFIKNITRKMAYENGLILPPLYMMIRLSEEEKNLWIEIMEEGGSEKMETRWKMYIDSCRESYPDLTVATTLKDKFDLYSGIRVCVLNPAFNIDEVEPELAMDVIILKTFDSLTSYEQLLIKCSAILGDIFPRDMLMYIMSSSAVRLTALAVQKLFEIHVLSCARGNFVEGGLVFKERLKNPNEETEVTCQCKGLVIDENCQDLPKYASCGYMRFLSTLFRETTYNLLTDNQKREFHTRAIRYLEKETRKCRACGNGYFTRYMGNKLDYELKCTRGKKKGKARFSQSSVDADSIYTFEKEGIHSLFSRESGDSKTPSKATKEYSQSGQPSIVSDSINYGTSRILDEDVEGADFPMFETGLGLKMIQKYKNDFNITRTFSDTDYSQCTCPLILTTMYVQMIEHCSGAGLVEKMLNAMIDFCYVCIESDNVPQALKILYEAIALVEGPLKQTTELDWVITLKKGKLYAIMGWARMKLQQVDEGYKLLHSALDCYGVKFPSNSVSLSLRKMSLEFHQNISLFILPVNYSNKNADDDVSNYYNDLSECLGFLCKYFLLKKQYKHAKLAAMWSLKEARWSATDFNLICLAYANMIRLGTLFGEQKHNIALEVFAFEMCNRKRTTVEREELTAVGKLYFSIFFARIGSSTHMTFELLSLLPMLVMLILMRKHIVEAGNIMQDINQVANTDIDISGLCWYHALCVNFHLETGLVIEPIRLSVNFSSAEGREPATRDPDALTRLTVVLWLWNVRTENWEGAVIWEEDVMKMEVGDGAENLLTALYLLEGMIISMVRKIDKKSIGMVEYLTRKVNDIFKTLFKASKSVKVILPRLYHLKSYYHLVKTNNYQETIKMLRKATKLANKYGNEMEVSWITHNEQAWCNKLTKTEKTFWRTHSEDDNHIEYSETDEYTEKFGHFSLPIPTFL